jgi:uncharacterized protein YggE
MKNLVLLFICSVTSLTVFSQDPFCEAIVVEGKSSVKMAPEVITFNINFSVSDTNYTRCADLALQKIESIKARFAGNGIDEELIKTVNYSIREERERDRNTGQQIFKGYRADIPILIKTKVDNKQNNLIFEIIKNNFEANFRLNFVLSPNQIVRVKEELIELAVEDAKSKAQLLAKSAGIKLGEISKIQYGEPQTMRNFTRTNYDLLRSGKLESDAEAVGISAFTPPDIEMRTNVIIAWRIEY